MKRKERSKGGRNERKRKIIKEITRNYIKWAREDKK
jgi:phenylpyruvate tautomerase PptA (4-oxalocrotonate tautomerase family)